jgi:hypothetical protein
MDSMQQLFGVFLSRAGALAGMLIWFGFMVSAAHADTITPYANISPYSEPFHKQGRGWYPSIYWSTGRNLGSYYFPNMDGELFRELTAEEWNRERYGVVYFYRPDSQWASEELEAPSYYINDEVIFNLRGGSYTYVLLPEGTYDFAVRKSMIPLFGLEAHDNKLYAAFDFNLQANVGLNVTPGKEIWIRHSEVSLPARLHPDLDPEDPMAKADVQLVERELALSEIIHTRYLTESFWHPTDTTRVEGALNKEMEE